MDNEAEYQQKYQTYSDYILNNLDDFIEAVNDTFSAAKEKLKPWLIKLIADEASDKDLKHYEWDPESEDGAWFDHSGHLKKIGDIDLNESILSFLEEYTGEWYPTYESGRGKEWQTVEDSISQDTIEKAEIIMTGAVKNLLKERFPGEDITEEGLHYCDEWHDRVYDDCPAYDFFCVQGALEYVGISADTTVRDIIELAGQQKK